MSKLLAPYDVETVRADFPILTRTFDDGASLVYLDSANTSQKPQVVIDTMSDHFAHHNANVARAMHRLGAESTEAMEAARAKVARFIGAARPEEIVFTKNASEALNLLARVMGDATGELRIGEGDEVVISEMEHHSNIVPWQLLCERTGATLRWFGLTDEGRLDLSNIDELINERTKVVSVAHVSNTLGTINPISMLAEKVHAVGALLFVDASQAVPQMPYDVSTLGADAVVFTGHKMVGPTGVGVLWGRYDLLEKLPPFLGGGEMIEIVKMSGSTYAPPPARFEAGTPPIVQIIGLGAAVDYLQGIGMDKIAEHEQQIAGYTLARLQDVSGVRIIGPASTEDRGGAISFDLKDVHPHDVGQVLDSYGIAVRGGHHCARPVHERFGIGSSSRVSPYLYTTTAEIDAFIDGLEKVKAFFRVDY
ncbi:aminotransferase class V-fold PLP-dependent enzyme [Cumulibacter manganitolerans]|uniref:aminotransferase class V-fold PLP-dependent enzyme n=1 Tax=Cumulibacter manganitolerans TaxID=1884992 RepID=UPI0012953587|nr:cysteine desulfurase [Cumulibacter manganitolerans]